MGATAFSLVKRVCVAAVLSCWQAPPVGADCGGPFEETFETRILTCRPVVPESDARLLERVARLPAGLRAEVLGQYRGLELGTEGGRLFVPGASGVSCADVVTGGRSRITVGFACCDGDPNPPCYLGYREYVKAVGG
jgi:hypothetical protein